MMYFNVVHGEFVDRLHPIVRWDTDDEGVARPMWYDWETNALVKAEYSDTHGVVDVFEIARNVMEGGLKISPDGQIMLEQAIGMTLPAFEKRFLEIQEGF